MCEGEDSLEESLFPAMWVPEIALLPASLSCVCVGEEVMGSAAQNDLV